MHFDAGEWDIAATRHAEGEDVPVLTLNVHEDGRVAFRSRMTADKTVDFLIAFVQSVVRDRSRLAETERRIAALQQQPD